MLELIELSEIKVITFPPLKNLLLDFKPEKRWLENCGYEPHFGLRPKSEHWRKSLEEGCFHITLHRKGKCRMHWDAWDPRKYPLKHFLELISHYGRNPRIYLSDIQQSDIIHLEDVINEKTR
jgi:hypothetical protein